ncbi:group II intron reverse transcriptase/maturase [Candidatus Uabimicrobium amorphum]|uniref:RNA-directed DNA polymerase n=1 Tax=Uabimicrobium amorphum TaxID=2596890 RepID=A0A5S9IKS3_UABAM|nr:group II intron reverse transcriptase/maturase [Candidatus Uabimicrobium amorphum]BBM83337.1 group II intron reverse transcriptase/maturase [Candidatus Uabimicrobium amorphum]
MGRKRRKNQIKFTFLVEDKGEAQRATGERVELPMAKCKTETSKQLPEKLMEEICERENLRRALKRVKKNKGSPGIDGMTVEELQGYLCENWLAIRKELMLGNYKTKPVKRVEIPKIGKGLRKLGIPCVLDRFVQQATLQVIQRYWDREFSENSYGFRPKRSAHQAIAKAQKYIEEGNRFVVDIDLEKFFDRVNHDKLMGLLAQRIKDNRVLKLIREFLNAGVMENGLVKPPSEEGTPQGGPLSPLLSNIVLDVLDCELERREHNFVRYADDCNIYVKSRRAGKRVMANLTKFITRKLKLKVNGQKSAVARPWKRKFLGFSFTQHVQPKRRLAHQSIERFKRKIRVITKRTKAKSIEDVIKELSNYLHGWLGYYRFCQTQSILHKMERWMRRRLRCYIWKGWKRGKTRFLELRKRGVGKALAAQTAGSACGVWRLSNSPALNIAFPNSYFEALKLPRLLVIT